MISAKAQLEERIREVNDEMQRYKTRGFDGDPEYTRLVCEYCNLCASYVNAYNVPPPLNNGGCS